MKRYLVKEIFLSIAGEGYHTGRPALFVRFAGCNLWSGREEDRDQAICPFCDTKFVGTDGEGGGKYALDELLEKVASYAGWLKAERPFLVFTGGEPSLQLDENLVMGCKEQGYEVAIETNGTRSLPPGIDWVCVSPKMGADWVLKKGNELKVVYPQEGLDLDVWKGTEFDHFYLQPDWNRGKESIQEVVEICQGHQKWKMSPQIHKFMGLS
jgi:7-carboxy-7-deazaguanine synthase